MKYTDDEINQMVAEKFLVILEPYIISIPIWIVLTIFIYQIYKKYFKSKLPRNQFLYSMAIVFIYLSIPHLIRAIFY